MRVALTIALAGVALALPASALGASTLLMRSTRGPLESPALAGDSVVVASYLPKNLVDVLRATPGSGPQRLLQIKPRVRGQSGLALLAASAGEVLMRSAFEGGDTDLLGGPSMGPLSVLESCPQSTPVYQPATPAIDAGLSIWSGEGCVPDRLELRLGAVSRTIEAGGAVASLAAAGHYAAWISSKPTGNPSVPTPTLLTVYDAHAGAVAYSAQIPPATITDVDSDGTAVVAPSDVANGHGLCGRDYPSRITYYTLAEPTAHPVPVASCASALKIAAGRIAFEQRLPGGSDRLALTNLAGTAVQPVAAVTTLSNFDYDGAHVAWTQSRCRDDALFRRDAGDSSAPDPAITCPVRVGAPRLSRDGTLHVAVSCPSGCRPEPGGGSLQGMQLISPHWLHVVSKTRGVTRYTPFVRFSLRAGERTVIRLPLTASQRAGLRRHPRTSVRLKVLLQNVYLPRIARTTR
jgi:hypothetical protein